MCSFRSRTKVMLWQYREIRHGLQPQRRWLQPSSGATLNNRNGLMWTCLSEAESCEWSKTTSSCFVDTTRLLCLWLTVSVLSRSDRKHGNKPNLATIVADVPRNTFSILWCFFSSVVYNFLICITYSDLKTAISKAPNYKILFYAC